MSDQLPLLGIDPPRPAIDRLFFAIFPDEAAAGKISETAARCHGENGMRGRPLLTDRFHVTLIHIDDFAGLPQSTINDACDAAAQLIQPPFEVTFDRTVSFSRAFVLKGDEGVAVLKEFRQKLFAALQRAGIRCRSGSNFTPHVTLLYDDLIVPEQIVEPVSWTAGEFVLVHSILGETRHIPLARWPLRD